MIETVLFSYLPALLGMLVIALLVLARQRKPAYIAFSLLLFSFIAWLAPQAISVLIPDKEALWVMRFSLSMSCLMSPIFLIFAILYPNAKNWLSLKKTLLIIFPGVFFAILSFCPEMLGSVEHHGTDLILHTGYFYDIQTIYTVLYILSSLGLLGWKYFHLPRPDRAAILMLLFAFIFPVIVGVLTNYVWINNPGAQFFVPITLFFTAIIIAYAMIRYKLFDIRLAVARGVAYGLLLLALLVIYVGAIFVVTQLLFGNNAKEVTDRQTIVYFIFAVLLAFTYNPLKRFFDKVTDRIFYHRDFTPQEILSQIGNVTANEINFKRLSADVVEILFNVMKPDYVYLTIKEYQDQPERKISLGNVPAPLSKKMIGMIERYHHKVVMVDYIDESGEALQTALLSANIGVVVRLQTAHESIGYLVLGPKRSGSSYSIKDESFFKSAGNELALAIQNSLRFGQIQEFNETLQAKVDTATERLRNTNRKLRQLDEAKDEFVSMASHQLRTPLTSVKGYISMVLEGDAGKISPTQQQLLSEAFTSSERMVHLIGDFLNVSRLQTGKFILESRQTDLAVVTGQEIQSLQTTAEAHDLKLEYHQPSYFPKMYIDDNKIRQVIMNFVDNSIYYSEPQTTIKVTLEVEDGEAVLRVHDTGIGVPKKEQEHLFTKFFRATNARKQRPDGTGVGLFLAKKVIDAHGGSIVFESKEGEGSVFGFRLPIKKLSSAPAKNTN